MANSTQSSLLKYHLSLKSTVALFRQGKLQCIIIFNIDLIKISRDTNLTYLVYNEIL
jgi:hypothetical protein